MLADVFVTPGTSDLKSSSALTCLEEIARVGLSSDMSTGGQVLIVQCPVLDPIGRSIFGWPDSTVSTVQLVDACILEKDHVTCMSSKLLLVVFGSILG